MGIVISWRLTFTVRFFLSRLPSTVIYCSDAYEYHATSEYANGNDDDGITLTFLDIDAVHKTDDSDEGISFVEDFVNVKKVFLDQDEKKQLLTMTILDIDSDVVKPVDSFLTDDFLFVAYDNMTYHLYYIDYS